MLGNRMTGLLQRSSLRAYIFLMAIFTISTFVTVAAATVAEGRAAEGSETEGKSRAAPRDTEPTIREILAPFMSAGTVDVLARDEQLRRSYIAIVSLAAHASRGLADAYDLPELRDTTLRLETYRDTLHLEDGAPEEKRQIPDPFGLGINGAGSAASATKTAGAAAATSTASGGILGSLGGALSSLTAPLTDALGSAGQSILGDLGGAAMFLGTGLGAGAASGFNLTTAKNAMVVAMKVAVDTGNNATGLNPSIMNAAMGAVATLAGSINASSLTGLLGSVDVYGAALGLSTGIGNGTAAGLKMSIQAEGVVPPNSTAVPDIAGAFGFGMTKSLASNVNMTAVLSGITAMAANTKIDYGGTALAVGEGIGNGAAAGLKLNAAAMAFVPPNSSQIPDVAGAFTFGMTKSISSNVNVTDLLAQAQSMLPTTNDTAGLAKMLSAAAAGFGRGIGEGVSVAVGTEPDGPVPMMVMPDNGIDVGGVAEGFSKGLISRLLANGTMQTLVSNLGVMMTAPAGANSTAGLAGLAGNLDVGSISQGFVRGLMQGAGDSLNMIGGINALMKGTTSMPPTGMGLPNSTVAFNDSLGGAAAGFGQGIGGQGVLVAQMLFSDPNGLSQLGAALTGSASAAPAVASAAATGSPAPAAAGNSSSKVVLRRAAQPVEVVRVVQSRQNSIVNLNSTAGFNLSVIINQQTVSSGAQQAVDTLTCEGIGGLGLVGLGLFSSGALNSFTKVQLTPDAISSIRAVIPTGNIRVVNEGNVYDIDGQQISRALDGSLTDAAGGIDVNGNKLPAFIAFLVLHILIGIIVFFNVAPLAVGLESTRNLLVRLKMSHILVNAPRWNAIMWFFVITPSVPLVVLFGALVGGNGSHFRTAHGIIGLLTAISGLVCVALQVMAKKRGAQDDLPVAVTGFIKNPRVIRNTANQLFIGLCSASVLTGFGDLSSLAFCLTAVVPFQASLSIGMGLSTLFTMATGVAGLEAYLLFKDSKKAKGKGKGAEFQVESEKTTVIIQENVSHFSKA